MVCRGSRAVREHPHHKVACAALMSSALVQSAGYTLGYVIVHR